MYIARFSVGWSAGQSWTSVWDGNYKLEETSTVVSSAFRGPSLLTLLLHNTDARWELVTCWEKQRCVNCVFVKGSSRVGPLGKPNERLVTHFCQLLTCVLLTFWALKRFPTSLCELGGVFGDFLWRQFEIRPCLKHSTWIIHQKTIDFVSKTNPWTRITRPITKCSFIPNRLMQLVFLSRSTNLIK